MVCFYSQQQIEDQYSTISYFIMQLRYILSKMSKFGLRHESYYGLTTRRRQKNPSREHNKSNLIVTKNCIDKKTAEEKKYKAAGVCFPEHNHH